MSWELKTIGELFKISSGGTPSREKSEYYNKKDVPWIKTGDLKNTEIHSPSEYISEEGLKNSSAKKFPINTVLIAMYGATIGACSILKIEAATNQACAALLPTDKVDEKFTYYYLRSIKAEITRLGVGGAQPNISAGILKAIKIPLPPLETQKKIAEILDIADNLRQKDKALIEKYNQLTQSLFLEMFGDPVRNEKLDSIRDYIKILGGYAFKSKDFCKEGIPVIKIGTVNKGYFDLRSFSFLPKEYIDKYSKWCVKPGDLLISLTGTVGKDDYGNVEIATWDFSNYFLNQRVAKLSIIDQNKLNYAFLYYLFKQSDVKKKLVGISRGIRQANISNEDILKLSVFIPPIDLQNKFASMVEGIEKQKQLAEENSKKSEDLFNALLQKAFRVSEP